MVRVSRVGSGRDVETVAVNTPLSEIQAMLVIGIVAALYSAVVVHFFDEHHPFSGAVKKVQQRFNGS